MNCERKRLIWTYLLRLMMLIRRKKEEKRREVKSLKLLLGDKNFRRVGWGRDKIRLLSMRLKGRIINQVDR